MTGRQLQRSVVASVALLGVTLAILLAFGGTTDAHLSAQVRLGGNALVVGTTELEQPSSDDPADEGDTPSAPDPSR